VIHVQTAGPRDRYRFGDFQLDVSAYELRRHGRPIKLGRQVMDLLILLIESRGHLLSRGDIVDRLWGKDVFVDVETGVNTAISKVRQALRDSPDAPAFVETVPGRGYRFIATVEVVPDVAESGSAPTLIVPDPSHQSPSATTAGFAGDIPPSQPQVQTGHGATVTAPPQPRRVSAARLATGLLAIAIAAVAGVLVWTSLGAGNSPSRVTLAVLPFENFGSDPERQYLAQGFTDETAASLAQIDPERLSVKGRTLGYKGTTKSASEIGRELSVDYLVEGSVRREGPRVRVTATLTRVRDQEHVWSQSYEREPTSVLGLQQDLSMAIAEQVRLRVAPDRLAGLERRQTRSADAYDAYLKGRHFTRLRTAAGNKTALEHYKRAIALDPNYALAWSELSFTYTASVINGDAPPRIVGPLAQKASLEALRSNPQLAEAHATAGYVRWLLDWDWMGAQAEYRQAISLDPGVARTRLQLGHLLSQMGRHREAEEATLRARELEPLDATHHALSAQVSFQARDNAAAIEHARQAILLDPTLWIGYVQLGQAYAQAGETDLALEALAEGARFSGGNSKAVSMRGYVLAKAGRATEAREVLRSLESPSPDVYVPPYAAALVHAGLGERDAVFQWLAKAFDAHDVHLMYLPVDAKWDPYRDDPRFQALVERCGFTAAASPAVAPAR
jgi:TolB-like protein/DNA-binding winged helix-turn-helix (wHTH) protein/Flp pilus assembly protein TadD